MCKRLCIDLKVGDTFTIRYGVLFSWELAKFPNGTVTILELLEEAVPGCSCKEARPILSSEHKTLHPLHAVNCHACPFYIPWHDRGRGGSVRKEDG